jgi:hypothetical protein
MRNSPAIFVLLLLTACARPQRVENHADWLKESTRVYAGETRARVIAAAEAVLKHADGRDTRFEYNQNGFSATRPFGMNALAVGIKGEDRWTFSVREGKAGSATALRVIRSGTASAASKRSRFRENVVYLGSFRLFYARIEYVLGRRTDWISCEKARAALDLPGDAEGTDLLCGITHQSADAPPERPPAKSASPSPAMRKAPDLPTPPDLSADPASPDE